MHKEDKGYLRKQDVYHHSDGVLNKTNEKDIWKHSTKCAEDYLDKSVELCLVVVKKRFNLKY